MALKDFYEKFDVSNDLRIPHEKNILLTLPNQDYDVSPILKRMGVGANEVAITWPKDGIDINEEINAVKPLFVAQVDKKIVTGHPVIGKDGDWSEDFEQSLYEATADRFVSLHHHDEYSIKDG